MKHQVNLLPIPNLPPIESLPHKTQLALFMREKFSIASGLQCKGEIKEIEEDEAAENYVQKAFSEIDNSWDRLIGGDIDCEELDVLDSFTDTLHNSENNFYYRDPVDRCGIPYDKVFPIEVLEHWYKFDRAMRAVVFSSYEIRTRNKPEFSVLLAGVNPYWIVATWQPYGEPVITFESMARFVLDNDDNEEYKEYARVVLKRAKRG